MPFGLTNAPSTFQSLMNEVFKPYLRKFVLVFFDDILIYSKSISEHLGHLKLVLQTMQDHTLYAKRSKCTFAVSQVEYLGHIISDKGVATDPAKIESMKEWPIPKNVKQLRGFLGLTGYYRRFIKGYAVISKPLTVLLKKNSFMWNEAAQQAFEELKNAMVQAPVLGMPNFEKEFTVETDACGNGIGAVLQQDGHPLAYLSKSLSPKHQVLSTYEKEFLAVILALERWKGYLMDRHFKIKTDHFSLKYLLDQRLTTPFQAKWLPKLLGYDYEIAYKKGSENIVADALSRREVQGQLYALVATNVNTELLKKIEESWVNDMKLAELIQKFADPAFKSKKYTWTNGQLRRNGKLVVGNDEALRKLIFSQIHNESLGGHSGVQVTVQKLSSLCYWKNMRKMVKQWVRECDVCQRCKPDLSAYPGLMQPLPIPVKVWSDISMDFVEGLPKSNGKTVILVVVDRLSKYAHFLPLQHPFTATQVAQVFLDNVYKLHDLPNTIVSDRDKVFLSNFWQSLFKVLKVKLHMSTAYHPQTDGQSEVVNRCLECYLRCMSGEKPKEWTQWIAMAEFWYNTNFHSAIQTTPFEVLYGQSPPIHMPYLPGESNVEAVDRSMQAREQVVEMLKFHLKRAQDRMKSLADKHRTDREFEEGVWVYLKLQPYRQSTNRPTPYNKLSSKYYGPFQIQERVGKVAYKLQLPSGSQIHPVFHVSQLKLCKGSVDQPGTLPLPMCDDRGMMSVFPAKILDRRLGKMNNRAVAYVMVQWSNGSVEEATWELYSELLKSYPEADQLMAAYNQV